MALLSIVFPESFVLYSLEREYDKIFPDSFQPIKGILSPSCSKFWGNTDKDPRAENEKMAIREYIVLDRHTERIAAHTVI